ncbi:HK97 family phage prohead protease [Stakelama marina]|uniref:HK97 family phage prohead protease n=1 Tax=Stakelama marina TaxID=2826939 RepID=A0A8T4IFV5_9SPHN|nr:HK97 family phage prohead protease [Stakelama marina]MBR0553888.1 HK97 family phage prohead protease [Stakelama marina]
MAELVFRGGPPPPSCGRSPSPCRGGYVRFAGYAAVFDAPDRGGDVVRRGAFAGAGREVPLLWQHKGKPVGRISVLGEDARGLRVIGAVDEAKLGRLVQRGAVTGLSFGYRARAIRRGTYRELVGLDLIEVSLVAQPMQPLARVHAVVGGGGAALSNFA